MGLMSSTRSSMNRSASVVIVFTLCLVATGLAYQTGKPWPPGLQKVSDESPVLSPEDEMKTFFMPPGYHVELVASEPMIEEPILIDWDPDGRMWVIEERGYMQDLPATNEREPIGRISVLEDTNNDGKMDKKTVFMDGLVLPRALKVLDHGVLIGEPPHLWLARDTNGDLKIRYQGIGRRYLRPGARQHRAQREQPHLGARQLDVHVRAQRVPATEGRQVRLPADALARPVGRDAGRCRADLPEYQRGRAVRRSSAGALLHAQSESGAYAWQL